MKKLIPICIICFYSLITLSQTKKKHLQSNINVYIESHITEKTVFNKYYKIVQFNAIPSQLEKNQLKKLGLVFLEYISENSYIVSFPSSFQKKHLKNKKIKNIYDVTNNIRLSKRIKEKNYPSWAIKEKKIGLFITFYNNLDFKKCLTKINVLNHKLIEENKFSKKIVLYVNQEKIHSLLNEKYIRYIDIIPEYGESEDNLARNMCRSNLINTLYNSNRKYDGTGISVAINDDGFVGPHIDVKNRTHQSEVINDNTGTHGDMVAGILGGAGNLNPINEGIAKGVTMHIREYLATLPNTVYYHQDHDVTIFSTSNGTSCNEGYTSVTNQVDQEVSQNPSILQVFSAGNKGNQSCNYGNGISWGNITGGHKQGKNVIACANLNRDGSLQNNSSKGPASDGRIKPDISAQGEDQISIFPNNYYTPGGGTSASAPVVAGIAAQLYQAYKGLNSGVNPESALIKACLLNSAEDIGNKGPDFKHGWGRVHALRSLKTLEENRYFTQTITQGNTNNHTITIPPQTREVKIMVYWTDFEGSTSASTALVNNIDTKLIEGNNTYLPWVLDHTPDDATLDLPATKGIDDLNNMEQISLVHPNSGDYTLEIHGKSIPQGPQTYWVVYEFIYNDLSLINPNGGEGYSPGENIRVFWDTPDNTGEFTFEYSDDNGNSWNTVTSSIPGDKRYYDWNVPNINSGDMLARLSRGNLSSTSNNTFSIISPPSNISITKVCPLYMKVTWSSVTGADKYIVYLLGDKYMDSVGTTTDTYCYIPLTNYYPAKWVSVASSVNNIQGNIGKRAKAIESPVGILNCNLYDAGIFEIISPNDLNCSEKNNIVKAKLVNYGIADISNIPVKYQINNSTIINETYNGTLTPGTSVVYTFSTPINLLNNGTNAIKVWSDFTGDNEAFNDTTKLLYHNFNQGSSSLSEDFENSALCSIPYDCENTLCHLDNGWINLENGIEDDIDWIVNSGSTPTPGTGPNQDHTNNSEKGRYIYLEPNSCLRKEAVLLSSCIDLSKTPYPFLKFWYHMNTVGNPTLSVDIFKDNSWQNNIFSFTGNSGLNWVEHNIALNTNSNPFIRIRIRGKTGDSFYGDIAIDDIQIVSSAASTEENIFLNSINIYPNPSNGNFIIEFKDSFQNTSINLINMLGQSVYQQEISQVKTNINTNDLAKGIYTIFFNKKGRNYSKLIVIK